MADKPEVQASIPSEKETEKQKNLVYIRKKTRRESTETGQPSAPKSTIEKEIPKKPKKPETKNQQKPKKNVEPKRTTRSSAEKKKNEDDVTEKPKEKRKRNTKESEAETSTPTKSKKTKTPTKQAEKKKQKKTSKPELEDEDHDSDFEKPLKKKGKLIESEEVEKKLPTMRNRCSPGSLLSVIIGLSEQQRDCVRDMGFGALLKMKMDEVPGSLSFYVLGCFDPDKKQINLPNGKIKVNRKSVNDMLGLPMGSTTLESLPFKNDLDEDYKLWKNQFENNNIRLQDIKNKIISSSRANTNFKINFLILMVNALCESTTTSRCNYSVANYITKETKIEEIDWCTYLINSLVKTHCSFDKTNKTPNFVGPSLYLVLLYADHVNNECILVDRKRPAICQWTSEKLKFRETYEKDVIGSFGTGEINEKYIPKVLDVEEYYSKINTKTEKLMNVVDEAISKHPENKTFKKLKKKVNKLFVEDEVRDHDKEGKKDDDENQGPEKDSDEIEKDDDDEKKDDEDKKNDDDDDDDSDKHDNQSKSGEEAVVVSLGDNTESIPNSSQLFASPTYQHILFQSPITAPITEIQPFLENIAFGCTRVFSSHLNYHVYDAGEVEEIVEEKVVEGDKENVVVEESGDVADKEIGGGEGTIKEKVAASEDKEGAHETIKENVAPVEVKDPHVEKKGDVDDDTINKTIQTAVSSALEGIPEDLLNTQFFIQPEVAAMADKKEKEYIEKKDRDSRPSFDLQITQLTPDQPVIEKEKIVIEKEQPQQKQGKEVQTKEKIKTSPSKKSHAQSQALVVSDVHHADPISFAHPVGNQPNVEASKRNKRPGPTKRSPFKDRVVDIKADLTTEEEMISDWLLNLQGEQYDEVIKYQNGVVVFRFVLESLYFNECISYGVIEAWAHLLNHHEPERNIRTSPYRLFLPMELTRDIADKAEVVEQKKTLKTKKGAKPTINKPKANRQEPDPKDENRYKKFKEEIINFLHNDQEKIQLKDIELVFFPTCQHAHIYVFVFNLKFPSIQILDNSNSDATLEGKYMPVLTNLKKYFIKYLNEIKHPRAYAMQDPNLIPNILKMSCKTKDNKTDCGIFTMRYMETYMGKQEGYKTGLPKEGGHQDILIERMRRKYAHRLIMSDINLIKEQILKKAKEYHNTVDKKQRLEDEKKAAWEVKQRLASCGEKAD